MTDAERRAAAKSFSEHWKDRGDEKQDTAVFWIELLQKVYGVDNPAQFISFEMPVKLDHTSFIDAYIEETRVLIEQKGINIDLSKGYKQSDGSILTPFGQARRYAGYMPFNRQPRWIVVSNFKEFQIHDMNRPNDPPEIVELSDLEKEYQRLYFLTDIGKEYIKKEMEVSIKAGELVGVLYDALLKQYKDPDSAEAQRSLNMLCVRFVFCLYAEDAGVFGGHTMFHDYLVKYDPEDMREHVKQLFYVLDTPVEKRDPYLKPSLAAFPYVNGGLFAEKEIEIPQFTEEIKNVLLKKASADFDWSQISPTIFGALFESTLNRETRRKGGMHYTSIENIHKVIDPLFLNDLKAELSEIKTITVTKTREKRLREFQEKLSHPCFFDPACGSGNFLTETYISLRRLENEVISLLNYGQLSFGNETINPIKVSIGQFYGIEINDFAVTVAKTALWIAESQMMKETEDVVHMSLEFLPLRSYANITEGNALRMDWEKVVPKEKVKYIMGNPPFVGYAYQTSFQKEDLKSLNSGMGKNIDYVAGWYYKAADYMEGTDVRAAFVSTNSITQGEQVAGVWKPLYDRFNIHIDFAHRTFRWDSEASIKAHVHCVIVGFSTLPNSNKKRLQSSDRIQLVDNINAYLLNAPTVFIEKRSKPLCDVPAMCKGSQPTDGGNLILSPEEKDALLSEAPEAKQYIRAFIGADEYINNKRRYCLWLVGASPAFIKKCRPVRERVENVRNTRLASTKASTRQWADKPTLFTENRHTEHTYIIVPSVSSEQRKYVPIGFLSPETVASNLVLIIPDAKLYHFGVLTSNVHMAWMRAVCGRLKSDYRYSNTIVYNNFPWPSPTEEQKAKIEKTAQAILDARELNPESSLADLYDEASMTAALRRAHQDNDRAVMAAYGFPVKGFTETDCVSALMRMYAELARRAK
ncbi:MAG: class I SAM-dependent DNA methyltransferase [Clostridia bacterium]|nr:class I SAM-dependent DNA methyltransferase [Clostridia bacterium]